MAIFATYSSLHNCATRAKSTLSRSCDLLWQLHAWRKRTWWCSCLTHRQSCEFSRRVHRCYVRLLWGSSHVGRVAIYPCWCCSVLRHSIRSKRLKKNMNEAEGTKGNALIASIKNHPWIWGISGVVVLAVFITLLVVFLQPSSPSPSPTPTPTPSVSPQDDVINVSLSTTVNGQVVCVAFGVSPYTLQYATCGNPSVQGTWQYNRTRKVLINNALSTTKTNCMVNPEFIIDARVHGQSITQSESTCEGIQVSLSEDSTITGQSGAIFVALLQQTLGWTTMQASALTFTIVET